MTTSNYARFTRTDHSDGASEVLTICTVEGKESHYVIQINSGPSPGDDFVGLYDLDGEKIDGPNGLTWEFAEDVPADVIEAVRSEWETGNSTVARLAATTDSCTCGASPTGWNVYRTEGDDETHQTLVGSAPTQDEARRLARPGDQIQHGLDGVVVCP